eukprot:scaffold414282_cov22-Prasinocladus_malaysianus.AAC.1
MERNDAPPLPFIDFISFHLDAVASEGPYSTVYFPGSQSFDVFCMFERPGLFICMGSGFAYESASSRRSATFAY